uniref:Uncharacterized protein n=1 Tax=uncultured bacterium Contig2 TaxID=1393529 RepID=W0FJ31_9BACT|nr:hypothetical protein [uncultured bacterium Contig2]
MHNPVYRIGILVLVVSMAFSVSFCSAFADEPEERVFPATADWVPPEIDAEQAIQSEPWLLVLKTAQGEIGYVEGPGYNASKYGEWFGDRYTAWCAEFLTWCVYMTDEQYGTHLMKKTYPYYGHPKDGAPWFLQRERFIIASSKAPSGGAGMWLTGMDRYLEKAEYIPYPGDYMWISFYSVNQGTDHVAIVEGVSVEPDGSYLIHVIEGNNPDRVQRNTYRQSWGKIYGYGTPVRRAKKEIRLYNRSNDVLPTQQYLFELGYLREKQVTSDFGAPGVAAVKQYQKDHGLKITGRVDLATRTVMEEDPRFIELIAEHQK